MGKPFRVTVVGGGPAGLAAASRLLEQGGPDVKVKLLTLGHHLGGKAASWRDSEGRLIDHGQHVVVGFYREMKALLRRAGVEPAEHLVSNGGVTHVFEDRDGRVHDSELHRNPIHTLASTAGYSGFTSRELVDITRFVTRTLAAWSGVQPLEPFDDVCFTAWCFQNGLPASVLRTNAFRMSRDGQLNYPGEISAYQMLIAIGKFDRGFATCEYGFPDGGMTERFWDPIGAYLTRLGGELRFYQQAVGVRLKGDRVAALEVGEPDPAGHERKDYVGPQHAIQPRPGATRVADDFDALVLAMPEACFRNFAPGNQAFWSLPMFARMRRLRSVPPLGLQLWHREKLTRRYPSVIGGLPPPLSFVIDNKHVVREFKDDPRYGSVLYFVGQEAGFENLDDDALLERCLASLRPLPGFERIDRRGVLHFAVVRNRGPQGCYWYTEPGSLALRPTTVTPLSNLFLAGDWVRNELDFPCMEAAVRSGLAAADATLAWRAAEDGDEAGAAHRRPALEQLCPPRAAGCARRRGHQPPTRPRGALRPDRVVALPRPPHRPEGAAARLLPGLRALAHRRGSVPVLSGALRRGPRAVGGVLGHRPRGRPLPRAREVRLPRRLGRLGGDRQARAAPRRLEGLGRARRNAHLRLDPRHRVATLGDGKPVVCEGRNGLFDVPPTSHLFYTLPRMPAAGHLTIDGERLEVTGLAWVKHEWGYLYSERLRGWVWFGVQLDSGEELQIGLLRDRDWQEVDGSFAEVIDTDGVARRLELSKVGVVQTGEVWTSPRSGVTWPIRWKLELPERRGSLVLSTTVPGQELWAFPSPIWAGSLEVKGTLDGRPVHGQAMAEIFGLEQPFLRRFYTSGAPGGGAP